VLLRKLAFPLFTENPRRALLGNCGLPAYPVLGNSRTRSMKKDRGMEIPALL
jgi:hypothetical protein